MKNVFFESAKWDDLPNDIKESILRLRYEVFVKELGWSGGLDVKDGMETDQYDTPDATYLYFAEDDGKVTATCRLIPTTKPYMLKEIYPHAITNIPIPCTQSIWEISRFCASVDLRRETKNRITGIISAAIIEFGLRNNIRNFIALGTNSILPVIRRYGGWDPTPIGELISTPDDNSYAVIYTVTEEMLSHVKKKAGIESFEKILR